MQDLQALHDAILEKIKKMSRPWEEDTRLFHLGEEVGELFDIYLQYKGMKERRQDIKDIENALNDVMIELFMLYDAFGIDIAKSLSKEIEQ